MFGLGEPDAALSRAGFEAGFEIGTSETVDESTHELEVHAADEVGVVLRQRVKRAVGQSHARRVGARFVAKVAQHIRRGGEDRGAATTRARVLAGTAAQ